MSEFKVYADNYQGAMEEVYEVINKVAGDGYNNGYAEGVEYIIRLLRKIVDRTGGISQEVIDLINTPQCNDEDLELYIDGLNEQLEVGDEVEVVRRGEEGYVIGWRGVVSGLDYYFDGHSKDPIVMGSEGGAYEMPRSCLKKTGTHYNLSSILQKLKNRNTVETTEVCPHCGAEVDYEVEEGTMRVNCGNCGKSILLCSLCEDHSDCRNCPF